MTRIEYRTDAGVTLSVECEDMGPGAELEPWLAAWANALDTVLGIDAAERLAPAAPPFIADGRPIIFPEPNGGHEHAEDEADEERWWKEPPLHAEDEDHATSDDDAGPATCRHCDRAIVWRLSLAGEQDQDPSVPGTGWADDGSEGLPFWCVSATASLHEPAPQP